MFATLTVVLATLATLSAAVPHSLGHSHLHKHLQARNDASALIAGRSASPDGSCGSWSGYTCGAGFCCGADGWCGNSTTHCGAGCQTGFGQCGAGDSAPAAYSAPASSAAAVSTEAPVSTAAPVPTKAPVPTEAPASTAAPSSSAIANKAPAYSSPDVVAAAYTSSSAPAAAASSASSGSSAISPNGLCGPKNNDWTCQNSNFGDSCSKWGYCGSNSSYSGEGCQSSYGTCGGSGSGSSAAAPTTMATSYAAPSAYTSPLETAPAETPAPAPATSAAASTTAAAPPAYSSSSSSSGTTSGSDSYKMYTGNGEVSSGWPSQDSWVDFESAWSSNLKTIGISCAQFGQADNSDEENANIKSSIQSVASSTGVDERFILAIMMQESKGCVRVPTTNYGVVNPGLMQSHAGSGTCNDGSVQDPCPETQIKQMISDGSGATTDFGLSQTISQAACSDVSKYYKAARIYNSGSVDSSGDLGAGIATHCYASDIANRLTGWVSAASTCTLD